MRNYLLLRARMLGRQLRELGWWRFLLLGLMLGLASARALFTAAASPHMAWAVPPVVAGLALSLHRQRDDLPFLFLTAPRFRRWLATEYSLLCVPIIVPLLGWGRLGPALLTLALTAAVALAPAAVASAGHSRKPSWFRSVAFEWVSSMRRPWVALVWLGLLLIALATWRTTTGPALVMVSWLLLMTDVYGPPEPWTWLLPALRTPGAWLRSRVGWAMLYFGLTVAPLAAVMASGPGGAGGTAALLLWCAAVLLMVVLAKYAFYPHAALGRLAQVGVVVVGISILGSNPAYLALLVACFFGVMIKSKRRLQAYCPS